MSAQSFIQSLSDTELVFLKKYRLSSYLKTSQEKIRLEFDNRSLSEKEKKIIQQTEFSSANTGCPRSNSNKFEKIESEKYRSGRADLQLVMLAFEVTNLQEIKSEKQVKWVCQICGFHLHKKESRIQTILKKLKQFFPYIFSLC